MTGEELELKEKEISMNLEHKAIHTISHLAHSEWQRMVGH